MAWTFWAEALGGNDRQTRNRARTVWLINFRFYSGNSRKKTSQGPRGCRPLLCPGASHGHDLRAAAAVVGDGELAALGAWLERRKRDGYLAAGSRRNLAAAVVHLGELEVVGDLDAGEAQRRGSVIGDSHGLRLALGAQFLRAEAQAGRRDRNHGSHSRQLDDLRLGGGAVADADGAGLHALALRLKADGETAVPARSNASAAGVRHVELPAALGNGRDG